MMYPGKVNASGCASALDKFEAMQVCFASGSAENKVLSEELVDKVGGTLPCHGTLGNCLECTGTEGNKQ